MNRPSRDMTSSSASDSSHTTQNSTSPDTQLNGQPNDYSQHSNDSLAQHNMAMSRISSLPVSSSLVCFRGLVLADMV